jgi:hypothetical protein
MCQSPTATSAFTLAAFLMGGITVPIPYALRCAGTYFKGVPFVVLKDSKFTKQSFAASGLY